MRVTNEKTEYRNKLGSVTARRDGNNTSGKDGVRDKDGVRVSNMPAARY